MTFEQIRLFLAILDRGSLAAAGRELGLSPATVSERLAALEGHFGVRLLNRTTRSLSLTEEGRVLADGAERLLAEAAEIDTRLRHGREHVAGPIRLSAPADLGRNRIARVLDDFLEDHPGVTLDLLLDDGYVDLAARGVDIAVRYGNLRDSGLMIRRFADCRRLVCAAPDYLARHGTPAHPDALAGHNCLVMRFGSNTDRVWPFVIDGRARGVTVSGNRIANDGEAVRDWCVAGHGLARKSHWDVADDLAAGRLVAVLEGFEPEPVGMQAVYPPGRGDIRRIALLLDRLARAFR